MAGFRLAKKRLYWWPVEVSYPDPHPDRAGQLVTESFTMQFEELPKDEATALLKEIAGLSVEEQGEREFEDLLKVSKGWRDVEDEAGQPIPFSSETLKDALQSSWFRIGVYRALALSLTGEAARKGN